ncbi:NTF2-related export protein-like [Drosophila novamexicana]|uniref:NTF2-related export protein-like n=1 Tax=Drosophila novamexicana TaxID=47314 RepID=UPI0011E5CCE1|nr:NTF2-related export protein-like [Drosophila novamexicana]
MDTLDNEIDSIVEDCCQTTDDFADLYYNFIDSRRDKMGNFYLDSAKLTWNHNEILGRQAIQKVFLDLPPSRHELQTLDSQPFLYSLGGQPTYIIMTSGTVLYVGQPLRAFNQSFVIAQENNKWSITSDCYRLL